MNRFIWINSEEVYDKYKKPFIDTHGDVHSGYDDKDEGFIYDTVNNETILDFGNFEQYHPSCGTAPDDKYLTVIMDALNNMSGE